MDFARALQDVSRFLDAGGFRHAVVGGVGLVALGLRRVTLDLDFVVPVAAQDALIRFLEGEGYETLHRSPGYSNHVHSDPQRGRLDFVYVEPETAQVLFESALETEGPAGLRMRVPRPEHLAAMKVQAMRNDPGRSLQEMADIRFLMALPGVDREAIHASFRKAGLESRFREIEATF